MLEFRQVKKVCGCGFEFSPPDEILCFFSSESVLRCNAIYEALGRVGCVNLGPLESPFSPTTDVMNWWLQLTRVRSTPS